MPVAISYGYHPCPPPSSLLHYFSTFLAIYDRVKILLQNMLCRTPAIAGWLDPVSIFHSTVHSWLEPTHQKILPCKCPFTYNGAKLDFRFVFLKNMETQLVSVLLNLLSYCCSFCLLKIGKCGAQVGPLCGLWGVSRDGKTINWRQDYYKKATNVE